MDKNIEAFLYSASTRMARHFYTTTARDLSQSGIVSPIEQRLFIALKTTIHILDAEITSTHWVHKDNSFLSKFFRLTPQTEIRPYVVDFTLQACNLHDDKYGQSPHCIIECDSWEFHDRTPEERAYEKKRDRYLQCQGYLVLRYTGREIRNDPYWVATDILARAVQAPACLSDEAFILSWQKDSYSLVCNR